MVARLTRSQQGSGGTTDQEGLQCTCTYLGRFGVIADGSMFAEGTSRLQRFFDRVDIARRWSISATCKFSSAATPRIYRESLVKRT